MLGLFLICREFECNYLALSYQERWKQIACSHLYSIANVKPALVWECVLSSEVRGKKSQYMWKQKFCRNRQKWEGDRQSCTLLTKGLPRSAPFHIPPLSNFIPVFLWILQEVLLPGKVFEGKNGYMGNRAKLQYLLIVFPFLECKIYWNCTWQNSFCYGSVYFLSTT